jgi:hypothetical protein
MSCRKDAPLKEVSSWLVPLVAGSGVTLFVTLVLDAIRHKRARADAAEDAARAEAAARGNRVEERSEAAASAIVPLLDQLRLLFTNNKSQDGPSNDEVENLLLDIRRNAVVIDNSEVRRRVDILFECIQDRSLLENHAGNQARQLVWTTTNEAHEAIGQLLRREPITADGSSLEKYKRALDQEYEFLEANYEAQVEEARKARAQELGLDGSN